jgi:hypothetical protein
MGRRGGIVARRQRHEGAVGHRLARAQPPVQRHRRAVGGEVEPVGVVDLVGLAGADRLVDARDRGVELLAVDAGAHVEHAGRARGVAAVVSHEPAVDLVVRQVLQLAKQQHAQGGRLVTGAPAGADQLGAPFVVDQQQCVQAELLVGLDLGPEGVERRRIGAAALVDVAGVEPARRPLDARGAVVEQGEDRLVRHQLQSSMSCLILWRFAMSSSIDGSLFSARWIASLVAS